MVTMGHLECRCTPNLIEVIMDRMALTNLANPTDLMDLINPMSLMDLTNLVDLMVVMAVMVLTARMDHTAVALQALTDSTLAHSSPTSAAGLESIFPAQLKV